MPFTSFFAKECRHADTDEVEELYTNSTGTGLDSRIRGNDRGGERGNNGGKGGHS